MEKFGSDFSGFDMQQAMKLAQSDAAKELFSMLQSANSQQLQSAMDQAATGNMNEAKDILQQLMANEQTRNLLQRIMEDANG